jgi:hypothetical protein
MFEINISACHLRCHGLDSRLDPRATLSDSYIMYITIHYKSPNIVYRANNVLVGTQFSI